MKYNLEEQLTQAAPKGLTDAERGLAWARIQHTMRTQTTTHRRFMFAFPAFAKQLIAFGLGALLVGGGTATAFAANDARPGDALYPIDRALEEIQLTLTPEDEKDALRIAFAEERLEEVEELLEDAGVPEEQHEVLAFRVEKENNISSEDTHMEVSNEDRGERENTTKQQAVSVLIDPADEQLIEASAVEALDYVTETKEELSSNDHTAEEALLDSVVEEIATKVAVVDSDNSFDDHVSTYVPSPARPAAIMMEEDTEEQVSTMVETVLPVPTKKEILRTHLPQAAHNRPVEEATLERLQTQVEKLHAHPAINDEHAEHNEAIDTSLMEEDPTPPADQEHINDIYDDLEIDVVISNGEAYIEIEVDYVSGQRDGEYELILPTTQENVIIDAIEDRYGIAEQHVETVIRFEYEDESDEIVRVTQPNGEETFVPGDTIRVEWTPHNSGVESIALIEDDDDRTEYAVHDTHVTYDGYFNYKLSDTWSDFGPFRIKLYSIRKNQNGSQMVDSSDRAFAISSN